MDLEGTFQNQFSVRGQVRPFPVNQQRLDLLDNTKPCNIWDTHDQYDLNMEVSHGSVRVTLSVKEVSPSQLQYVDLSHAFQCQALDSDIASTKKSNRLLMSQKLPFLASLASNINLSHKSKAVYKDFSKSFHTGFWPACYWLHELARGTEVLFLLLARLFSPTNTRHCVGGPWTDSIRLPLCDRQFSDWLLFID